MQTSSCPLALDNARQMIFNDLKKIIVPEVRYSAYYSIPIRLNKGRERRFFCKFGFSSLLLISYRDPTVGC